MTNNKDAHKVYLKSRKSILVLTLLLLIGLGGCYKVTEVSLMKGQWQIHGAFVNGGSVNQLSQLLPGFETNGDYQVYLMDEGIIKGEYYIDGVLDYEVWGVWELRSRHHLYMNIDEYVNGEFLVESDGDDLYTLYCDSNDVAFYDIGISTMVLKLERH
ncbi:MAG: hypothetical protein ACI865_000703 [Flavobacteriaceae bacterium]|jgi:hypothetical protein